MVENNHSRFKNMMRIRRNPKKTTKLGVGDDVDDLNEIVSCMFLFATKVTDFSSSSNSSTVAGAATMLSHVSMTNVDLGKRKMNSKMGGGDLYRCKKCKKSFGSYQALGGHRASTKRTNGSCCLPFPTSSSVTDDRNPPHECQICFKVFLSGQALGGHKRAHMNVGNTEMQKEEEEEKEKGKEEREKRLILRIKGPTLLNSGR